MMDRWKRMCLWGAIVAALGAQGCASGDGASRLHALFQDEWEVRLREDPLFATAVGRHEFGDRLPAMAPADLQRRADFNRGILERLSAIDRATLSGQDRVSAAMFERRLRDALTAFEFRADEIPITVDSGFHIGFARLPQQVPLATTRDYENYIARLRAFPRYVAEHVDLMRQGLGRGFALPRVVLEGYETTIASHVVESAEQSVFHAPFRSFPAAVPPAEQERLRREGEEAILQGIVPGYRSFLDFMTKEYLPAARTSIGASELPRGRDYYAWLIRHFTTLDLTAEQIHHVGLDEVKRILSEMRAIIEKTGFEGDFAAFLEFLRKDPRFYAGSPEELLKQAAFIAKRMDARLPALFRKLPRLPYGIEPVPEHLAPKYTAGRYVPAPVGSTRPGYYWVNTYALNSRPLYALEALTLHEAVPGHHLQYALSRELEGLPEFRRFASVTAFGEGWGLYAERLGLEAGFYTDPYSDFGRLTYEMWRACRLVVDTGIHAMGWTRQQAMDYLASHTALSLHEVRTETDRYISWPGQALAYKIGELKIRELRREAEEALGGKFDVREFHDTVLQNGPVPLTVLEDQVRGYIRARRDAPAP